ncbi:hypothetical protein CsSME_00015775 [Camellia sinensis var. sinensis]
MVSTYMFQVDPYLVQWIECGNLKSASDNSLEKSFACLMILGLNLYRLVSKGCKLVGCGFEVPSLQVSNDDLAKVVDTSDEWISVRTGIRNQRVLTERIVRNFI